LHLGAWPAGDATGLDDAWADGILPDLGSQYGAFEFCTSVDFAAWPHELARTTGCCLSPSPRHGRGPTWSQVGPHGWVGCCHARRYPKVLARSGGRSPQPPGSWNLSWSVASLPTGVQARRAEAGSQVHQLYGVPYTAREHCRSARVIRVDCLRSLLTGLLRGPWTHQLLGFLQAVGHHALRERIGS
jgi:hypothetical protein